MKKALILFLILFYCKTFTYGCPYAGSISSEIMWKMEYIRARIMEYEEAGRSRFLKHLPPYRDKWEWKYHERIDKVSSLERNSMRYPDVYQNIILFDERLSIMKEFRDENAYERYMGPGWAYSKKEKKQKIEKERAQVKEDALYCKNVLYECRDKIMNAYLEIFEEILERGNGNLAFYHDYGLLAYLNNNFEKSFELLSGLIDNAQNTGQLDQLRSNVYHKLGSVCVEVMAYDKAIKYLSEAIQLDPSSKETYFNRATAYFETGQFDLAIEDYLMSDKGKSISIKKSAPKEFVEALIKSTCEGASEAFEDFLPSLLSSAHGIQTTIWAVNPLNPEILENVKSFARACYDMGKCTAEYCKNVDWSTVDDCILEIKTLYEKFDQLSAKERGELFGHAIGKYGIDAVACSVTGAGVVKGSGYVVKGASAYRKLRKANRACILEGMAASKSNKKIISANSSKHAIKRESYFKSVEYNFDSHNKHVRGHNDFIKTGSEWEHNDPKKLLRNFAGKGIPGGNRLPGACGYRETVDFGEHIGVWRSLDGKTQLPTTRGTIHYGKKGAHIVPSRPNSEIIFK